MSQNKFSNFAKCTWRKKNAKELYIKDIFKEDKKIDKRYLLYIGEKKLYKS